MAVFSTRRGRPRKVPELRTERDFGTPELRQKRVGHLTMEPIDILLEKGLITREEHWCALHLRWLYTLRYGTPTVKACDPAQVSGILHGRVYTEWQEEREQEWQEALQLLKQRHCLEVTQNCTIYHVFRPVDLDSLKLGLHALTRHWCSKNTTPATRSSK
jgi:hypothetical protein